MLLFKGFIHAVSLFLLGYFYYQAIMDTLGADPVEAILHFTGIGAFNLLIVSLLLSPLAKKFQMPQLLKVRRLVGLYSFTYAFCHIASFLAFEVQFDWTLFLNEIIERPYITVGMVAFVVLLLLAVTSFTAIKRKMGRKWQTLHNFVYLSLALISVHFIWSVKSELIEPSIYIAISLLLLYLRKNKLKRLLK